MSDVYRLVGNTLAARLEMLGKTGFVIVGCVADPDCTLDSFPSFSIRQ